MFRLAAVFTALTCAWCVSAKPPEAPAAPSADSLAGVFIFQGLGKFHAGQFPNPLIDFAEIAEGAEVRVTSRAEMLEARYRSRSGKMVARSVSLRALPQNTRWENGALITHQRVPIGDGFILPGAARQYRGSRISRHAQGGLRITGTFTEKGLMLFIIPFTDHNECELVLKKQPR